MPVGLTTTFQYLIKTQNELADEVLLRALDSPHPPIRDLAVRAILDRRSPVGHHEIFHRFPSLDEHCKAIISERPATRSCRSAFTMPCRFSSACSAATTTRTGNGPPRRFST
jgi:hypothetical protein